MKKSMILATLFFFFAVEEGMPQGLKAYEQELIALAQKVRPSVVRVTTYQHQGRTRSAEPALRIPVSEFSGILFSNEGHIITVADSLEGIQSADITFIDGQTVKATIVGKDKNSNIGVLHISSPLRSEVNLGDSDTLKEGAFVISVGNPYGLSRSISTGIVSGLKRFPEGGEEENEMIQTTAIVNPGDAGGLVANSSGEIVGMISSTYRRAVSSSWTVRITSPNEILPKVMEGLRPFGGAKRSWDETVREYRKAQKRRVTRGGAGIDLAAQGINFVIPINRVKLVAKEIIKKGSYEPAKKVYQETLGILGRWPLSPSLASQLGMNADGGILVSKVFQDTVANKGGMLPHDIIISIYGDPINSLEGFKEQLLGCKRGESTTFIVIRKGKKLELKVDF